MKSYTNLEQSKKLATILPLESADMWYDNNGESIAGRPEIRCGSFVGLASINIPCWSLAALLEQLPYEVCNDDGISYCLEINKDDDLYQLGYIDPYGFAENIYTGVYEHFVDACYEMVIRLHELKML